MQLTCEIVTTTCDTFVSKKERKKERSNKRREQYVEE